MTPRQTGYSITMERIRSLVDLDADERPTQAALDAALAMVQDADDCYELDLPRGVAAITVTRGIMVSWYGAEGRVHLYVWPDGQRKEVSHRFGREYGTEDATTAALVGRLYQLGESSCE